MAIDVKIEKRTLNFSEDKKEVYVDTADSADDAEVQRVKVTFTPTASSRAR